jgi:competence protein ComEA
MIKRRLKEYFQFTKKERNGILVLIFICIAMFSIRFLVLKGTYKNISIIDDEFIAEIERFEKSLELIEIDKKPEPVYLPKTNEWKAPDELFAFDPNTITAEDLKKLAFTEKQVSTILKYREKGGKFINKADLQKIYGITKQQYDLLEPYIKIKESDNSINQSKKEFVKIKPIKAIEINSASESELTELNGIGESFAKRICKYREIIGGFYKKEQLLEVYGMDSTRYNLFLNQIIVDSSLISKIDINTVKFDELLKRQFLNKYQVQAIIKYREIKGGFVNLDEIPKNKLVPENVYVKIKPYLVIK